MIAAAEVVQIVGGGLVAVVLAVLAKALGARRDTAEITDTITGAAHRAVEMVTAQLTATAEQLQATRDELAATRQDLARTRTELANALSRVTELEGVVAALSAQITRDIRHDPNARTRSTDTPQEGSHAP